MAPTRSSLVKSFQKWWGDGSIAQQRTPEKVAWLAWSQAASAVQRSAWQSIETAPRDGTKFLAWDGDELLIAWWCDGGRWISDNLQQYHPGEQEDPTHWQPLPSPPPIIP